MRLRDSSRIWSEASNNPDYKTFPDEDPPFFLRRASSSTATNVAAKSNKVTDNQGWSNAHREIMHAELDSTVRDIIDDLTVENRLLRARNKIFERRERYDKGVDRDKLFEVSFHNISPGDARDLEDLLSAFVRSRNISRNSPTPHLSEANIQTKFAQSPSYHNLNNPKNPTHAVLPDSHATQSGASSNKLDSGYASMSMTTGPRSTSNLNNAESGRRPADINKRPHLLDVPRGLLPTETHATTERNKKKMVVRRLEELFTGNKSLLHRSNHTSDHNDDRSAAHIQVSAAIEGSREAKIMAQGTSARSKDIYATHTEQPETESEVDDRTEFNKTPEQRPTRLLDLDPERQQIPADNVDYMRHLGISTPNLQTEDIREAGPDAEGWVYLNLLMNLAQLHIMNVTAGFVRDAVVEVSSKFQLSSDGRRLRWRGGTEPTQMSSIGSSSTATRQSSTGSESPGDKSDDNVCNETQQTADLPHAKPKTTNKSVAEIHTPRFMTNKGIERQEGRHVSYYSPIFSHPSSKNTDSDNSLGAISSEQEAIGRKRIMTANIGYVPPTKKRKISSDRHGGMVFYNDAPFFVDLTGANHHSECGNVGGAYGYVDYSSDLRNVLGCEDIRGEAKSNSLSLSSQYLATRKYWDRLKLRDSILPSPDPVIGLDDYFDHDSHIGTEDNDAATAVPLLGFPIPMEASGLGCISPADHFLETITTRLDISRPQSSTEHDASPALQAESVSSSESQSKSIQNRKRYSDMELVWQRIQCKVADLHSTMKDFTDTTHRYPGKRLSSDDSDTSPPSLPMEPSASVPTSAKPRAEPVVTRKIIDATFRQLEPSPIPPPGLYLSELSESTEYDSGSESSTEGIERAGQSYSSAEQTSRDHQYHLTLHEQFRPWDHKVGCLSSSNRKLKVAAGATRRLNKKFSNGNRETSESSGVGDEEDEDDESIDMLGFAREADPNGTSMIEMNWEIERTREMALDDDTKDEVTSLVAVGSPLRDSDSDSEGDDGQGGVCDD